MANENLKQTKNFFKVIGKVARIDKDNAYNEAVAEKGQFQGTLYRSLRFGVKTSDTNTITVEMFDFEPEKVFLWNSEKRKADENYKGEKMNFDVWESQQDELREEGYAVLQTRIGVEYDEKGKLQSKGLPSFVASEYIYENLDNDDSVVIEGEIRYGTYENREGKTVEKKQYIIKKLHKISDVDFEDAEFEEVTYFEQEMVFVSIDIDNKEGKAFVIGRTIDYKKNFHDTQMIINFKDAEGENDKEMVKLVKTLKEKVKFGDVINVFGDTLNRVIVEEVEDNGSDNDDPFKDFGGKKKPKHAESFVSKTYVTEMQIMGVDAWDKKVYKEADFVKDELIDNDNEFGGKKKKKTNPFDKKKDDLDDDPFASDGEPIDISDDDLPF